MDGWVDAGGGGMETDTVASRQTLLCPVLGTATTPHVNTSLPVISIIFYWLSVTLDSKGSVMLANILLKLEIERVKQCIMHISFSINK
jgi:hypothetical protein